MNYQHVELCSVGPCFGLPDAQQLNTIPMDCARFSVTKLCRTLIEGQKCDVRIPACEAYFLMIYLADTAHADILANDKRGDVSLYTRGTCCLVDLEEGAAIELHDSLNSLGFVLPKLLFHEVAEISSLTRPTKLLCRRGYADDVLLHLGSALVPFFEQSAATDVLFRHMATAICAHLVHHYSDRLLQNGQLASSLPIKSEKAAKEYIIDNLGDDINIADIASAVGLSPNHFAQQFRNSTGLTPHRWLTTQRIERAKDLLLKHVLPLKSIASECGFSDQSHFTRAFSRETGMPPAAWRRARTH